MTLYEQIMKDCEEADNILEAMDEMKNALKQYDMPKIIEVRLFRHEWANWCVTAADYDASCEDGENWTGSHISSGSTMEAAIENYIDWMANVEEREEFQGEFVLSIEGPTNDLQLHAWIEKRKQQNP